MRRPSWTLIAQRGQRGQPYLARLFEFFEGEAACLERGASLRQVGWSVTTRLWHDSDLCKMADLDQYRILCEEQS